MRSQTCDAIAPSADDDTRTFQLDDLYRLTQVRYLTGTLDQINYRYDPLGNLVSQTSTVPAANLGVLRYGQSAGPHALTQVGNDVWRYDLNGNLSSKPGFAYGWDSRDHLVAVTGTNGLRQDSRL